MKKFIYLTTACFWLLNTVLLMLTITGCQTATNIRENLRTQTNSNLTEEEITAMSTTESEVETSSKEETEAVLETKLLPADKDIFNLCIRMIDEDTSLPYIADKYVGIDNNKAHALLEIALKRALCVREQYQKDRALEDIISVYLKMNDIDKATKTADLMSEEGLKHAILMFSKSGYFDVAENYINMLREKNSTGLFFVLYMFGDYAVEKGNMDKAIVAADMSLELLYSLGNPTESLSEHEFSSFYSTLKNIAALYAKAGKFEQALKVSEYIIDPVKKCFVMQDISLIYVQHEKISEGIKILNNMRDTVKSMDSERSSESKSKMLPESIAATYIEAGEYKEALDILANNFINNEYIELYEYATTNINLLSNILVKSGDEGNEGFSDTVFTTLLELANSVESGAVRGQSLLQQIIDASIENGMIEKAEIATSQIKNKDQQINCYSKILNGYISFVNENPKKSNSYKQKALDIIYEIFDYAFANPDYCHIYYSYICKTAEACVEFGFIQEAGQLLDMIISQSEKILSGSSGNWLLETSSVLYCRMDQYEKAVKLANLARNKSWEKDYILMNICEYYTEKEQISRVLETIELMELPVSRARAYSLIEDKYIKQQQLNKTMEMLDKAFYEICFSVDSMKGYHNEVIELFNITDQYVKLHRKDKAALALSKCLETIENIKEKRTKASYLADIDAKYIKSGIDIGKAEKEILQEIFLKLQ